MSDLQDLQILENSKTEEKEEFTDNESLIDVPIQKPKRERTQKQIEAFNKAREKMMENAKLRKEQKEQEELKKKKEIEEKIVKKAISIKKKEIKQKAILDDISDDDTPIEVIKKVAKTIKQQEQPIKQPEKPKSYFDKYKFI